MAGEGTLATAGELEVVRLLAAAFGDAGVPLGIGDDAAVLPGGQVACVDLMVEGVHFRRDWSSAADVGHRAAARSLIDVRAMGAVPAALMVGVVAPPDLPLSWLRELAEGIRDEAGALGARVVGGDTVVGPMVMVSISAVGDLRGMEALTRGGALAGDDIAVAGDLGRAAAGLAMLQRGHRQPRALVDAHRRPSPPYDAAGAPGIRALIDVSDGLALDAGRLARASHVDIEIESAALAIDPQVDAMARNLGIDPLEWVLGGGDDHALLAAFPPGGVPAGYARIGRAVEGEGVVRVDGAQADAGFTHF